MKQTMVFLLALIACSTGYSDSTHHTQALGNHEEYQKIPSIAYAPKESMDAQIETSHPSSYDFNSSMQNQYNSSNILLSKALYKQADMFRAAEEKSDIEELNDSQRAKGPTENFLSFFDNVFSAMTLGFYQPDNKPAPTGVARVVDPVKKLVWDAPKSLLYDTPSSIVYTIMGDDEKKKEPSTSKITQR